VLTGETKRLNEGGPKGTPPLPHRLVDTRVRARLSDRRTFENGSVSWGVLNLPHRNTRKGRRRKQNCQGAGHFQFSIPICGCLVLIKLATGGCAHCAVKFGVKEAPNGVKVNNGTDRGQGDWSADGRIFF
jgi:hypothetical protein